MNSIGCAHWMPGAISPTVAMIAAHKADCVDAANAEIARRRAVADALVAVRFEFVDGHEHETAGPQRKVGVERRDSGPVVSVGYTTISLDAGLPMKCASRRGEPSSLVICS